MHPSLKLINSEIVTYNLFSTIAYLIAGFLFYLEAKRKQFHTEKVLYVLFGALLGGLIGSRLGSAFFVYWGYYSKNFLDILILQLGGKTLIGGLIGGYIGVVVVKKILKFGRPTGDLFAPGLALGIAIGRIGCFFNGCCYGIQTNLLWGTRFNGGLRHPTQIYESIFCLFLFIYLWSIRKRIKREGDLFKIFIFAYTFFRFWVEFLRADKVGNLFSVSIAQFICLIVFIILGIYFIKRIRNGDKILEIGDCYGKEGLYKKY